MQLTVQPCITAGVALAAAGVIAITPGATPSLPHIRQVPEIQLTASTSDAVNPYPIDTWSEVLQTAQANLDGLEQEYAAEPAIPALLSEVVSNWVNYTEAPAAALAESSANAATWWQDLPAVLHTAGIYLWNQDVAGAVSTLWNSVAGSYGDHGLSGLVTYPLIYGPDGIESVLDNVAGNIDSVLTGVPIAINDVLTSPEYAFGSALAALVGSVDDISYQLSNGDWSDAVYDLFHLVPTVAGGYLNGYDGFGDDVFNFTPFGLLTYTNGSNGPLGSLQLLLYAYDHIADITSFTVTGSTAADAGLAAGLAELPSGIAGFFSAASADITSTLLSIF